TASSILDIAQSGYQAQMSILQTIKAKVTQAADASTDGNPRTAISSQVTELLKELDDIANQTKWNNSEIFYSSATEMKFHVGADSGDTFTVTFDQSNSANVGNSGTDLSVIDLSNADSASDAMQTVDNAIQSLAKSIQSIGDKQARLASKEEMLASNAQNTEAIRSSIEDADFAREQMEVMKLQILQQTSITALTQANAAPQSVLSLFR
ncbi:MAG: flagellin, partial [FCB group bacterium]|nr:flagellin [FCB group bacterium]